MGFGFKDSGLWMRGLRFRAYGLRVRLDGGGWLKALAFRVEGFRVKVYGFRGGRGYSFWWD